MKRARVRMKQNGSMPTGRVCTAAVCPACAKKDRHLTWPLLVIGFWRILSQIFTSIDSVKAGTAPWQQAQFLQGGAFWGDLAELLGFLVAGLFGAVLVVLGLPRRRMIAAVVLALCFTVSVGILAVGAQTEQRQTPIETGFVVNLRSGMAHHADCTYVAQIHEENKAYYEQDDLDGAVAAADTLCSRCFAQMTALVD